MLWKVDRREAFEDWERHSTIGVDPKSFRIVTTVTVRAIPPERSAARAKSRLRGIR